MADELNSGLQVQSTQGHEDEVINVAGLKAALQKFKTDKVDPLQWPMVAVAELPTATASTMHKIYLVPSTNPKQKNAKDEFITIDNGSEAQTRYTWEQIGSTTANLSGYVTQVNVGETSYSPTSGVVSLPAYPTVPVTSVASKTGDVTLNASDVGAASSTHTHGNIGNGGTLTDTAAAAAGDDYVVIRDASDSKIQTSTIKGTDVADAVSKKHEHSSLTLSTTAQVYDGTHTLALPSSDPYSSARTPASHTHGNITNEGTITSTDVTTASGFLVYNSSNYIHRTTVADAKTILGVPTSVPSKMSDIAAISTSALSADVSSTCSITGSSNDGKMETIVYTNSSGSDKVVTVPTTYATPDGAAIELTVPNGGYCEVNYLNIGGTIYARGL